MTYPGGKNGAGVYQAIINQMPPHDVYIEPFFGSGGVMQRKKPAQLNIAIDLDDRLPFEMAMRAGATRFVLDCGIEYLKRYDFTGRELVYCDPPYLHCTRRSRAPIYRYEMSDADHSRLLTVLQGLPCMVMLSGYWSIPYAAELSSWRLVQFKAMTRRGLADECLWMNFAEPDSLHDFSFLGADFRQRERIKRKVNRWCDRLAALPRLERLALLSAMRDLASPELTVSAAGGIAGSGDVIQPSNPAMRDSVIAGSNDAPGRIITSGDGIASAEPAMRDSAIGSFADGSSPKPVSVKNRPCEVVSRAARDGAPCQGPAIEAREAV